jgi:protein-S-isoprenylcysteine O-methyltransferase Ste14
MTIRKVTRGASTHEMPVRTEPLVLSGPQWHVRHPLFFAVVVLFIVGWLLLDYTFLKLMALFFYLLFTLVVIRFKEKELRALFGEEYEAYTRVVPMIFPSLRPKWN